MFSIGELSRRAGVKIPTIRYYEQSGLLDIPERSQGNQRRYSAEDLQRLSFIRHSRELGFSIADVRELLKLSLMPDQPCADADAIVARHLQEVRERLRKLKRLEKELKRMARCGFDSIADCTVIETLADHELCIGTH